MLQFAPFLKFISIVGAISVPIMLVVYFVGQEVKMSRWEKRRDQAHLDIKEMLMTTHLTDERFSESRIFECAKGYFITIAKTGYIGFKLPLFNEIIYHISDINGFKVLKDGYSSTPNIGKAAIGKALFGNVGGIVGGLGYSTKKIGRITFVFNTNNFDFPTIEVDFLDSAIETTSYSYRKIIDKINEILSLLKILEKEAKSKK